MAGTSPKKTTFKLDDASGTPVDISTSVNDVSWDVTSKNTEATGFNQDRETMVPGDPRDTKVTFKGPWNPTLDKQLADILG